VPKITFVNEHLTVDVEPGKNVRDVARANGVALDVNRFRGTFNCGGRGVCTACVCWVEEGAPGAAGPRSWLEKVRGLTGWRRLACRTSVQGDVRVFTMPAAGNRVAMPRSIAPPPSPTTDESAPRKPIDAASTAEHIHGHPSKVGRGIVSAPEPAKPAVSAPEPAAAAPAASKEP
jgi:ferredoxin